MVDIATRDGLQAELDQATKDKDAALVVHQDAQNAYDVANERCEVLTQTVRALGLLPEIRAVLDQRSADAQAAAAVRTDGQVS